MDVVTPVSAAPSVDVRPRPAHDSSTARWHLLDVLRGVALSGILSVNVLDITSLGLQGALTGAPPVQDWLRDLLYLTVQTRFVPIFAWLFGMSLWFMVEGARSRGRRPAAVLLRRLLALGGIGWLLALVYPGNILLDYAMEGVPVLVAALLLPRRVLLAVGAISTVGVTVVFGSNQLTDVALMLLGVGTAACGIPAALERAGRGVVIACLVAAAATAPLLVWQTTQPGDARFTQAGPIAGLAMAVLYVTALALLWRTRARQILAALFEPLGRMALTNYCIAACVAQLIDFRSMASVAPAVLMSLAIIAAQSLLSRLWLRRFRYGPLEWLWRIATWLVPVPLRRTAST